jgi:hypothetical protein
MKPRDINWPLLALAGAALFLSGCADAVSFQAAAAHARVGFWHGLWHGTILPFAWLISLFDPDVAIYAIYRNGGWYDFGFVLGVGAIGFRVRKSR